MELLQIAAPFQQCVLLCPFWLVELAMCFAGIVMFNIYSKHITPVI